MDNQMEEKLKEVMDREDENYRRVSLVFMAIGIICLLIGGWMAFQTTNIMSECNAHWVKEFKEKSCLCRVDTSNFSLEKNLQTNYSLPSQ